jgi:hypothetical protein
MTENTACAVWDFRANEDNYTSEELLEWMKANTKKYCFQLEESDNGYIHWQGRFSLIKKRTKAPLLRIMKDKPNYLKPTSSQNHQEEFFYAMKEDTRKQGPWRDDNNQPPGSASEIYIPKQYRDLPLRPWQQKLLQDANLFNSREINLIYDPVGNRGKSTVAAIAELTCGGIDMPPLNDFKELLALLCDICMDGKLRSPSPIFFDLPRALDKTRLYGIYSAIEQVKKGKLYDCRYHYKAWWIDSPVIWVFSNILPDRNLLSNDRWKIWTFSEYGDHLLPYDDPLIKSQVDAIYGKNN